MKNMNLNTKLLTRHINDLILESYSKLLTEETVDQIYDKYYSDGRIYDPVKYKQTLEKLKSNPTKMKLFLNNIKDDFLSVIETDPYTC